jgi:serine/threonine protein kinase
VAPEVITHEAYSSQIDMWSVGVIVYILLCGFPPFYGENDAQMFRKIRAALYSFLAPYWDDISADAKDFVARLLVVDPAKRYTAKQVCAKGSCLSSCLSVCRPVWLRRSLSLSVSRARALSRSLPSRSLVLSLPRPSSPRARPPR